MKTSIARRDNSHNAGNVGSGNVGSGKPKPTTTSTPKSSSNSGNVGSNEPSDS